VGTLPLKEDFPVNGSGPADLKTSEKSVKDKRAKFVELAESRTVNAIRAIRVIGKLGNKSAYEYDDADVKKIISALSKEVDALKARLGQKTNKGEVEFKL
jgi:hypothetical protein